MGRELTMIYGYCSADYPGQIIQRQKDKILRYNENTEIYVENKNRSILKKLSDELKDGDILVLNDILKLSDNETDFELSFETITDRYQHIFSKGADIVFLEQPVLDSRIYRDAIIKNMSKDSSSTVAAVSQILMDQIKIELKEVMNIVASRRENIKNNIKKENRGIKKGTRLTTRKEVNSKKFIMENHMEFGGTMSNQEVKQELRLANNTFYKYMRELRTKYNSDTEEAENNITEQEQIAGQMSFTDYL